jgi:hypothetical protein
VKEARHASGKACRGNIKGGTVSKGSTKNSYRSLAGCPGEKSRGRTGVRAMYTGTLISELMAVVERTEARVYNTERDGELERWYATQQSRAVVEAELLGVA